MIISLLLSLLFFNQPLVNHGIVQNVYCVNDILSGISTGDNTITPSLSLLDSYQDVSLHGTGSVLNDRSISSERDEGSSFRGDDEFIPPENSRISFDNGDDLNGDDTFSTPPSILFTPRKLIFKAALLSIPISLDIIVENLMNDEDIHIFYVSSSDSQFHPIMFQPQILSPQGSVTVQLSFLPSRVAASTGELLFSTSKGDFMFPYEGYADLNPYQLHPLVGYRSLFLKYRIG